MDLRQVACAVAVVDHGGFTRAAAALHLAQPSLSQTVKALEAELGVQLFQRLGRSVRLTEAGESFLGPARQLLRDANAVRLAVTPHAHMEAGTLDVVTLPTLAAHPLAEMVGAFRTRFPGVTVRVNEPNPVSVLREMVSDGRCEVGITDDFTGMSSGKLVWRSLGVQRLLAVLPPGSEVPSSGRMSIEALARLSLILPPRGTSTRDVLETAMDGIGQRAFVGVETSQREAIVPLVLAGAGASVLPEPLAVDAAARGAVVCRVVPALSRRIGLVHRTGALSPAARDFLAIATSGAFTGSNARAAGR